MNQSEMFPDIPSVDPRDYPAPSTEQTVWFYIRTMDGLRMLAVDRYSGSGVLVPLDLTDNQIMLFSSRARARSEAFQQGGEAVMYPYNIDHLFSR